MGPGRAQDGSLPRWSVAACAGTLVAMLATTDQRPAGLDDAIRRAVGYSVVAPEGPVGVVVGVPESGRPQRPLVLVVRRGDAIRFVSLRRVADVEPFRRRIVLGPEYRKDRR
jgi:hypothetical protein